MCSTKSEPLRYVGIQWFSFVVGAVTDIVFGFPPAVDAEFGSKMVEELLSLLVVHLVHKLSDQFSELLGF